MLGAALGFPVTLCMPSNVSPSAKRYLAAYGAEVVWTNPADGSDGAIRKARELIAAEPDRYFYADQYSQRRKLARPLPHHRQRDLGADRRPGHPLRRRPRHHRHLHGNHAPPQGAQPQHPLHLHAARLALQRPRRPQAHGHRHRAEDLRSRPRRRATSTWTPSAPTRWRSTSAATTASWSASPPAAAAAAALQVAEAGGQRRPRGRHRHHPLRLAPTST